MTQSTISKWVRGEVEPTPSQIDALERECDRPHGYVFVRSGWFDFETSSVETCIQFDTSITDEGREMLLAAYRALQMRAALS